MKQKVMLSKMIGPNGPCSPLVLKLFLRGYKELKRKNRLVAVYDRNDAYPLLYAVPIQEILGLRSIPLRFRVTGLIVAGVINDLIDELPMRWLGRDKPTWDEADNRKARKVFKKYGLWPTKENQR